MWIHDGARWQCFEADGKTVHWDTCSKRRWEQTVATGERFETADAIGYRNSVHGTKYEVLRSPPIRGDLYVPLVHRPDCDGAPPWEYCSCQTK